MRKSLKKTQLAEEKKISKAIFKPGTMLNPVPVVMVSCGEGKNKNIITIAWTGIINSEPPMTYVSIRKSRHSHDIIKETGEFVINLVTEGLTFAADYCGVKSGSKVDKFKERKLTAANSKVVKCPSIEESPVNIECRLLEIKEFPSHDMFMAEIVSVSADERLMDETGRLRLDEAGLIAYNHGEYFALEKSALGKFGYSVMKPKTKKRLEAAKKKPIAVAMKKRKSTKKNSIKNNR